MAVIEKEITLEGSKGKIDIKALFDGGSTYSCIRPPLAEKLAYVEMLPYPMKFETAKKGETVVANQRVVLNFTLKGYNFSDEFMIIDDLSSEVIIGAATMQKWRFKLDYENEEIIIDPKVTRLRLI